MSGQPTALTLGELKKMGYQPQSIKDELRNNLIRRLKNQQAAFDGIYGYEDTVIPELQTAILSRHNILLLGLRGQAKTRIARSLTSLLDEYIPCLSETELHEDPMAPITSHARALIAQYGDNTPIYWMHRSERYVEKLATPDVSVADLIGDLDPIKAANMKLSYSDDRVIHYGLAPRAHRCIFVINELPDLQARIQVALFNLLQEKDVQIRGFKVRLAIDTAFVFTANPEDYTNRGSIVTPLKDRIESQILTHYPKTIEIAKQITLQEAKLSVTQKEQIRIAPLMQDLVEQVAFEARENEFVDQKSGVSARLTITAYENLFSFAELRMYLSGQSSTQIRVADLYAVVPAITGKIELVYEGEQEGSLKVAYALISHAIRTLFVQNFPNPEKVKKSKQPNPYAPIIAWFEAGNQIDLMKNATDNDLLQQLKKVADLEKIVKQHFPKATHQELPFLMEFALHGLAEYSQISKARLERGVVFKDMLGSLFGKSNYGEDDE
jgi:magnesium chelatase subunit I